jgi:transcriptional regulator with XRE-family HTH domain
VILGARQDRTHPAFRHHSKRASSDENGEHELFEIGSSLREARERRGLELNEIERATRIRSRYLRALEEEQFGQLPGRAYAKGFLRTYADYLGLDASRSWRRGFLPTTRRRRSNRSPIRSVDVAASPRPWLLWHLRC